MKTIDRKALYKEAREILARTRYLLDEAYKRHLEDAGLEEKKAA